MPMMSSDNPQEQFIGAPRQKSGPGVNPDVWRGQQASVPLAGNKGPGAADAMGNGNTKHNSHPNDLATGNNGQPTKFTTNTGGGTMIDSPPPMFVGGPDPLRTRATSMNKGSGAPKSASITKGRDSKR